MKHITKILVRKNNLELVDPHIYHTRDKNIPHILVKFLYMFESRNLTGKTLELKYTYNNTVKIINKEIDGVDRVAFAVENDVFKNPQVIRLELSLVDDEDRFYLGSLNLNVERESININKENNNIYSNVNPNYDMSLSVEKIIEIIQENKDMLKGERGEQGLQGERGLDGAKGEQGIQGLKGEQGEKGLKGDKGDTGERGQNGLNGSDGISLDYSWRGTELGIKRSDENIFQYTNLKGEAGKSAELPNFRIDDNGILYAGDKSLGKVKGENGSQGMPGQKGDVGEKGEQGITGAKGEDGKSAFEVWKSLEGNANTNENDFFTFIRNSANQDTGWRKITSPALKTGFIALRRINNTCYVTIRGGQWDTFKIKSSNDPTRFDPAEGSGSGNQANVYGKRAKFIKNEGLPVGFRTKAPQCIATFDAEGPYFGMLMVHSTFDGNTITISADKPINTETNALRCGQLSYLTDDPFPTTLPGTAL